jgi:hypothetical protein
MSWLATAPRTLDAALALRPELAVGFVALESRVAEEPELDAALRDRCRRRIAELTGHAIAGASRPGDPREAAVLAFVEQVVLDPHGVSDAQVAALRAHLSPRAVAALAQGIALWEGRARLAHALGVALER